MFVGTETHQSGDYSAGEHDKQRDDHRSAGRAMTKVPPRAKANEIGEVLEYGSGRVDEIGETRPLWSDNSPDHADKNGGADNIAGPDVHREQLLPGKIGHNERDDDRPMSNAHKWIPNLYIRGHTHFLISSAHYSNAGGWSH